MEKNCWTDSNLFCNYGFHLGQIIKHKLWGKLNHSNERVDFDDS
jgi:hypothetical protein